MLNWFSHLPVWQLLRISGMVSFYLLTAGMALGILYSYPVWRGPAKLRIFKVHKFSNNAGTLIALIHGVFPVISAFQPYTWSAVLIPFAASDHRVLNGIGTLAAYLLLIVILTSDIRQKLSRKLWLAIHLLAYPIFIVVWIHGYFLGTDTGMLSIRWLYLMSIVLLLVLTFGRMFFPKPVPRSAARVRGNLS
jgi:methionine sulfoxide reductase heme-binding subunit